MGDGVKGVEGSRAASVRLLGELSPRRKSRGPASYRRLGTIVAALCVKKYPFDQSVKLEKEVS